MHDKKELERRMELAGIRPLKKLGQNFLLNPKIIEKIVEAAGAFGPKTLVEIGPGLGALTDDLVKIAPLTLVEIDSGLVEFWKKNNSVVSVVHEDALRVNYNSLSLAEPSVLVSNLPYSIAASLVVEMSTQDNPFSAMVLMFQKEVAERIQADVSSEDYAMPTVVAQVFWNIKKLIDAGPQDFFPVPHVGSRVLVFEKKNVDLPAEKFLGFVKRAFSQRRKKLLKNIGSEATEAFEKLGISKDARAQELNPQQFVELFKESYSGDRVLC